MRTKSGPLCAEFSRKNEEIYALSELACSLRYRKTCKTFLHFMNFTFKKDMQKYNTIFNIHLSTFLDDFM